MFTWKFVPETKQKSLEEIEKGWREEELVEVESKI